MFTKNEQLFIWLNIEKRFSFYERGFTLSLMINYMWTLLAAMTPLVEFRFAIPIGVSLGLPVWVAVLLSIGGALVATKLVLFLLPLVVDFARKKSKWLDEKVAYVLEKTEKAHSAKMKNIGVLGMAFFVMIPIPGSGVYTAVLLTYLFGWSFWKSWTSISIGAVLGSVMIGLLTASGVGLWQYILSIW